MTGSNNRVFNDPDYLALEASRLGGRPVVLPLGNDLHTGLIARPLPNDHSGSRVDFVSVYGYPDFAQGIDPQGRTETSQMLRKVRRSLEDQGAVAAYIRLGLTQNVPPAEADPLTRFTHVGDVVSVDLALGADAILAGYRPRLRSQLRQPHGLTVAPSQDVDAFHAIYTQNMRRLGARDEYFFSSDYLKALCALRGVQLITASDDAGPAASVILIRHGQALYYHLGATADRALSASPIKHLFHSIIMEHAAGPMQEFVLGGGAGGAGDSLLRFKRGFSKRMRPVHALRMVVDEEAYRRASGPAVTDDLFAGFFPAYREPRPVAQDVQTYAED